MRPVFYLRVRVGGGVESLRVFAARVEDFSFRVQGLGSLNPKPYSRL